jgi:hypothetical protein
MIFLRPLLAFTKLMRDFNLRKIPLFARGVDGSPFIVSDGAVCLAKCC